MVEGVIYTVAVSPGATANKLSRNEPLFVLRLVLDEIFDSVKVLAVYIEDVLDTELLLSVQL